MSIVQQLPRCLGELADIVVDGDIHYADNGYTALNTVLGQAGHAGITVKLGSQWTANAANKNLHSRHSERPDFHNCDDGGVRSFAVRVSTLDAFDVSSATNAQKSVLN